MVVQLAKVLNVPPAGQGAIRYVPGIANVEKVAPVAKPVVATVTVPIAGNVPDWPIVFGWACAGVGPKNAKKVWAPAKIVSAEPVLKEGPQNSGISEAPPRSVALSVRSPNTLWRLALKTASEPSRSSFV